MSNFEQYQKELNHVFAMAGLGLILGFALVAVLCFMFYFIKYILKID